MVEERNYKRKKDIKSVAFLINLDEFDQFHNLT